MIENEKKSKYFPMLMAPFFKPVGIAHIEFLNTIFVFGKFVSIALILLFLFKDKKFNFPKSRGFWALVIFWIIYLFNSLVGGNLESDIFNNAIISIFLMYVTNEFVHRGVFYSYIEALAKVFKIYFWIFVITFPIVRGGISLFSSGEGDYIYFLGTDNYSAFFLIPMIGIILINELMIAGDAKRVRRAGLTYIGIYLFIYTICQSITALMAGVVIMLLLLVFKDKKNIAYFLSVKKILIASTILLILINVFHVQNLFTFLLVDVLGKGITLNSRTIIWECCIELIKNRPILGYGTLSTELINSYVLYGANHAHNMILELLLRTGIIGTGCYIYFVCVPMKTVMSKSHERVLLLNIFLVGQFVLFFMDFYPTIQMFYCFMSVFYGFEKMNRKGVQDDE